VRHGIKVQFKIWALSSFIWACMEDWKIPSDSTILPALGQLNLSLFAKTRFFPREKSERDSNEQFSFYEV
jgi:hypothetical protein